MPIKDSERSVRSSDYSVLNHIGIALPMPMGQANILMVFARTEQRFGFEVYATNCQIINCFPKIRGKHPPKYLPFLAIDRSVSHSFINTHYR